MGGGDKSLQRVDGRPILSHIVERVRPQVETLVLNANGDPARFAAWDVPVLADNPGDDFGPMAGILAGMTWAARAGATDMVSIPTDTPFLPPDLVARLVAARTVEKADIAVAASGAYVHFATAIWPVTLAEDLKKSGRWCAPDRGFPAALSRRRSEVRHGQWRSVFQYQQPGRFG